MWLLSFAFFTPLTVDVDTPGESAASMPLAVEDGQRLPFTR